MVDILVIIVAAEFIVAPLIEEVAIGVEEAPIWIDIEALVFISCVTLMIVPSPLHISIVLRRLGWSMVLGPGSTSTSTTLIYLVELLLVPRLLLLSMILTLVRRDDFFDLPAVPSTPNLIITLLPQMMILLLLLSTRCRGSAHALAAARRRMSLLSRTCPFSSTTLAAHGLLFRVVVAAPSIVLRALISMRVLWLLVRLLLHIRLC